MKTIYWSKLKDNIAREAYTRVKNDPSLVGMSLMNQTIPLRERIQLHADAVWDTIMRWDVRQAHTLVANFPEGAPKWLRDAVAAGRYHLDQDDGSRWRICCR